MLDEYLDTEKSYCRLKEEFELHNRLIIAYDLDSTVFDYHHKNASYEMVKDLIRKYRDYAYFIIFTSSESDRYDEIKEILEQEDLPYDSINDDAPFIPFKGRKVYYNILLDDRAGLHQTYHELLRLYQEVIVELERSKTKWEVTAKTIDKYYRRKNSFEVIYENHYDKGKKRYNRWRIWRIFKNKI